VTKEVEYAYDFSNRWVRKVLSPGKTYETSTIFAYDGNQITLRFDAATANGPVEASNLSHRYLWGAAVDQILTDEHATNLPVGGDVLWALTDQLNTVRDLATYDSKTNTTAVVDHAAYDTFGRVLAERPFSTDFLFLFTARPYDTDSGLQNNLARWYDSGARLWVSTDPLAAEQNLYRYVRNSPITCVDPTGLWGPDVHNILTSEWAQRLWMPASGARLIAEMDDRVDTDFNPWPIDDQNWSWHFDRSRSGRDSRLVHADQELQKAEDLVDWSKINDDWREAALHMGRALHPLQDAVAHGDFNRWREAPSLAGYHSWEVRHYWHNWDSSTSGSRNRPDDATLDTYGVHGIPSKAVLYDGTTLSNHDRTFFAKFHPGTERIRYTERLTREMLQTFMVYVCQHSKPQGQARSAFVGIAFSTDIGHSQHTIV
jgi:RHS repeat-associated protein